MTTLSKPIVNPSWPVINLDDHGVNPGNSYATNTTAIANLITKVKAAAIPGSHLKLNRGGTTLVGPGPSTLHSNLRAAILLPSNCKFELGPATELKRADTSGCYVVRNDNPMTGNTDIEFCGGQVNGNYDGAVSGTSVAGPGDYTDANVTRPYYGFISRWENITRFHHHDQYQVDSVIWANALDVSEDCLIENITFDVSRDGYHLHGGKRITLRSLRGTCLDNFIAISTGEGQYWEGSYLLNDGSEGAASTYVDHDMSDILVDDLQCNGCNGPVRMFGYAGRSIQRIKIKNLTGTTTVVSGGAVQLVDDSYGGEPLGCNFSGIDIDGVSVVSGNATEPQVSIGPTISVGSTVEDVTIRNVIANVGKGVLLQGTINNVILENIKNPARSSAHLLEFSQQSKVVTARNCHAAPPSGSARLLQIGTTATWDQCTLEDCSFDGTSNTALINYAGTPRLLINLAGSHFFRGGTGVASGNLSLVGGTVRLAGSGYLSFTGSQWSPQRLELLDSTPIARTNGAGAFSVVGSQWVGFYLPHTLFSGTAATNLAYSLGTLPRGAVVTRVVAHIDTAFVGATVTGYVRRTDTSARLGDIYTLTATTTRPTFSAAFTQADWAKNATPTLNFYITSSDNNLTSLSAGGVNVYVEYMILGVNH